MKLAICIVHNRDRNKLADELLKAGFKFTVIGSTGGFLREGNSTLLIGLEAELAASLKEIVQQSCKAREQMVNVMPFEAAPPGAFIPSPVKVPVGGAVMFFLDVDEFVRY